MKKYFDKRKGKKEKGKFNKGGWTSNQDRSKVEDKPKSSNRGGGRFDNNKR